MTSHHNRALRTLAVLATALPVGAGLPASAWARTAPRVEQMVVFGSGRAAIKTIAAKGLTARVGMRRCAVGTATPLAALLRSKVGTVGLRDYASCSSRARDGGQIYVRSIGADRARGASGWVYKVGNRSATSGAADTGGPFGSGLLRGGQRVTWFFVRRSGSVFPRTLTLTVKAGTAPGTASVRARSYDDDGRGRPEPGVTVASGATKATTAGDGRATLTLGSGTRRFVATKKGLVRSFTERAVIR